MKIMTKIYHITAIIYIILALIYIGLFFCTRLYSIQLIGDKDVYLNINKDYFENGYRATFLNKEYKNVKVIKNINTKKVGDYKVIYDIPFLFFHIYAIRTVHVVDQEKPIIQLEGSEYLYLKQNEEYVEQGYKATDNVDGDITSSVEIENNLDITKEGNYTITYRVKDSSGNEAELKRNIEVIQSGLLTDGIGAFRLKGHFKDVILEYEEKEYDYFKDTIFLGDSNIVFLSTKGNYISPSQTWGKFNLNIAQINYSTFTTFQDNQIRNLESAINTFHPKYLIITAGLNSANFVDRETVVQETVNFINYMKTNHSDITIAISSIFPVRKYGSCNGDYTMNRVNEYNYYIVQECHKYHVNFINFTDEIKNEEGYGADEYLYCQKEDDCGFHLSDEGKAKYIDYIKHVNLERK